MFPIERSAGTGGVGSPEATESKRQLSNLIRRGKVAELDAAKGRIKVRIGDPTDPTGHLVTGWIPWLSGRAGADREFWSPSVGEPVVLFAEGGELASAIATPGAFSDASPQPADRETLHRVEYADGAIVEYDREAHAHRIELPEAGTATVRVGEATVEVKTDAIALRCGASSIRVTPAGIFLAGPTVAMTAGGGAGAASLAGNFQMDGSLSVNGDVSASGSVLDAGGNSNHHSH